MADPLVWDPAFACGDAAADRHHHALIAQCNALADHCGPASGDAAAFDAAFARFRDDVRRHLDAEIARIGAHDLDALEDCLDEREQFAHLAEEVATTANFDREELQQFVAVWLVGHIRGTVLRARLANAGSADA